MKRYRTLILLNFFIFCAAIHAQNVLTIDEAIAIAVEDNYDVRITKNNTKISEIESSSLTEGYLPKVSASGGISYKNESQNTQFSDGRTAALNGAETEQYNASITAEYTLFDGYERKFNNLKNDANLKLSQLKQRQQIENTIISIYNSFYNVAYQSQVVNNLNLNIANSKNRLLRAQKRLKYGQGSKLDELNAQVDLNNDSISYTTAKRDLNNAKRNLNLELGRDVITKFKVDTLLVFAKMPSESEILNKAELQNIQSLLANKNIVLSELDIKINKAKFIPKLIGSAGYSWFESQNPPTSFALTNESYGPNLGLNLSWNIFDGGRNRSRIKTSKIQKENREIELFKVKEQLKTDVYNAYETYENAKFTLIAQEKNVETNILNFERTKKQFSMGQVSSIEFRQAQINVFNARNNYVKSLYDLKIAEINLLQLQGKLTN